MIELRILGSGPTAQVFGKGKGRRRRSSILIIDEDGLGWIIDVTPDFKEQMRLFAPGMKIHYAFFTHGHNDAIGGLKQLVDYVKENPGHLGEEIQVTAFCERETYDRILEDFSEKILKPIRFNFFKPGQELKIYEFKFIPFRVKHFEAFEANGKRFPTVGLRIEYKDKVIVYSEDNEEIPEESRKYFEDADVVIFDAAMWFRHQIRGHQNVETALKFLSQFPKIKHIVLTQAGVTYPPYSKAVPAIQRFAKALGIKAGVHLAYDGMKIKVKSRQLEVLKADEETRGEAATRFWKENWFKMFPKSGKGRFCLSPDTPILTSVGKVINIEDVKPGERILDKNSLTQVKGVYESTWDSYNILTVQGIGKIECSPTHPFLVVEGGSFIRRKWRERRWKAEEKIWKCLHEMKNSIVWKEAKDIRCGDYLITTCPSNIVPVPKEIPLNENFWELLGWYISEGSLSNRNQIMITQKTSNRKIYNLLKICNVKFSEYKRSRNVSNYYIHKNQLFNGIITKYFGGKAKEKVLPLFVYSLPKNIVLSFLKGIINGDGTTNRRTVKIYTSSRSLAYGLYYLSLYIDCPATLMKNKLGDFVISFSRKQLFNDSTNSKTFLRSFKLFDRVYGLRVKYNTLVNESKKFIDITTTTHTFLCPVISHNTYHHHWRGLSEEESKLPEDELLKTEHSVHGDLRLEANENLWGFTIFLGPTEQVRKGRDFFTLKEPDKLQGTFKLAQPKAWLTFEGVTKPKEVGATSKKYAKFFIIDSGTYEIGLWREHFFEIFLHGKKIKGRYVIVFAPVGEGGRKWLIGKPRDQTPQADKVKFEDIVRELRRKKQKYLIWAKPSMKPKLIDVTKVELEELGYEMRFVLASHQIGMRKWLELRFERENHVETWILNTPGKTGARISIGNKPVAARKKIKEPLQALEFEGIVARGKPGASRDYPGIFKILDRGTYEILERVPGFTKLKLNGEKLKGVFAIQRTSDKERLEKTKFLYDFVRIDEELCHGECLFCKTLLKQLEAYSKANRTAETLTLKNLKILTELGNKLPERLKISGIALKEGTWNGLFYPREELQKWASMLKGLPIMDSHKKSVSDIVGRVINSWYNDALNQIEFEGEIWDERAIRAITEGVVNGVSVGVIVDRIREDGHLVAKNFEFKELSLVLVPACDKCQIVEVHPIAV
jgi:phosphoribosyl 1,2-cyclic phosphodiesterase